MGFTVIPSACQVEAKYLYNFARFVDWPDSTFSDSKSPIIIGVFDKDPFGIDLDKTVENEKIKGRKLVIKRFHSTKELKVCQILFIGSTERKRRLQILKKLQGKSILIVGASPGFAEDGGMVNFFIQGGKIRFEINTEAVKQGGLEISPQLLKLAEIVKTEQSSER